MYSIRVTNRRDITRLSVALTVATLSVVTLITVMVFPRDDWTRQIMVNWPTTVLLTYGATLMIGQQTLKVYALNKELQRLVSRDRLTDVATRDFFFGSLIRRPQGYGVTLMVDIDHFKQVNDTHGHQAGDKVIAHVARLLSKEVGTRDIVCRFGGEEFVVFLENATPEIARDVAERFRERVASSTLDVEGVGVSVTVSTGGSLRQSATEIDDAIRQADEALYRAKALGRNRTVMAKDLMLGSQGNQIGATHPAA